MLLPFLGLAAILVASVGTLACESEPESVLPEPKPKNDDPDCEAGTLQAIPQGRQELLLCHTDSQRDGIFQPETDTLRIREKDRFVPLQSSHQEKFGLPNFSGLSLPHWLEARRYVFGEGEWSLEREKSLSAVASYNREQGTSLDNATLLAKNIGPLAPHQKLTASEKAYALLIASLVLGLQQEKYQNFGARYPDFSKRVLTGIQEGQLKVRDNESPFAGTLADYYQEYRAITFNKLPDYTSTQIPSNLIHELSHFYNDLLGKSPTRTEDDVDAYLVEAEYLLVQSGFRYREATPQGFQDFIETQLNKRKAFFAVEVIGGTHPLESALWTLYHRSRGDDAGSLASRQNLELLIERITALFAFSKYAREDAGAKEVDKFEANLSSKASVPEVLKKIDRKMSELKFRKAEKLSQLKKMLRSPEAKREETDECYQETVRYWLLLAEFAQYRREIEGTRSPDAEFFDEGCKATIQEMFAEMAPLKFGKKSFKKL